MMRVRNNGVIAAEIPAKPLAQEAPLYSREAKTPAATRRWRVGEERLKEPWLQSLPQIDNHEALRQLLQDPTIASKNWVYRQYDHTVRTGTIVKPGSDAAIFFVRYANKILAATTDCNSLYCALDPREGGKIAVAEAARNLTCSGARPLALTDCLNFGNPYKPENFWQLREAVEGVAEACRAFGTPVTGGNVSLYNESPAGVVDPTPTIAMVGLIEEERHITTQWFKNDGDVVILVGSVAVARVADPGFSDVASSRPAGITDPGYSLGGSRYLKVCYGLKVGPPPHVDLTHEMSVQNAVAKLIHEGLAKSAHDCSEGGLAVALAESCFNPERLFGADIELTPTRPPRSDGFLAVESNMTAEKPPLLDACATLFNELQSRIIISVDPKDVKKTVSILREANVPFEQLGKVGGDHLRIRVNDETFRWPIADLYDDWFNAIRRAVEGETERIPSL
jgi:phosphoribosylformylglycinamidine synthase